MFNSANNDYAYFLSKRNQHNQYAALDILEEYTVSVHVFIEPTRDRLTFITYLDGLTWV